MLSVSIAVGFDCFVIGTDSGQPKGIERTVGVIRLSSLADRTVARTALKVRRFRGLRSSDRSRDSSTGSDPQPGTSQVVDRVSQRSVKKALVKTSNSVSVFELFVRAVLRAACIRPHVVHCHDFYSLPIGLFCSYLFGSIVVYDAHELESETNLISARKRRLCRLIEKTSWPRIEILFTVSESIVQWYESTYGQKSHAVIFNSPVVHPTIDLSDTGLVSLKKRFGIPEEGILGLYVGGLQEGRGIDVILELVDEVDDLSVVFLGEGPLRKRVQDSSQFGRKIFLHEEVDHELVVPLASTADVGFCLIEDVSMSDRYSLPNKLFEYAFAGIPVVCSSLPEIAGLVQSRNLGVVVDSNDEDFAARAATAVTKAVGSKLDWTSLSMMDEFAWQSQAVRVEHEMERLRSGLIRRRRRRRRSHHVPITQVEGI